MPLRAAALRVSGAGMAEYIVVLGDSAGEAAANEVDALLSVTFPNDQFRFGIALGCATSPRRTGGLGPRRHESRSEVELTPYQLRWTASD